MCPDTNRKEGSFHSGTELLGTVHKNKATRFWMYGVGSAALMAPQTESWCMMETKGGVETNFRMVDFATTNYTRFSSRGLHLLIVRFSGLRVSCAVTGPAQTVPAASSCTKSKQCFDGLQVHTISGEGCINVAVRNSRQICRGRGATMTGSDGTVLGQGV